MNTLKNVYDKIAKAEAVEYKKIELANHKIDLALLDDVKMAVKAATDSNAQIVKAQQIVVKSAAAIKDAMNKANIVVNKQMGKGFLTQGQKLQAQFTKMEKDLGVSLKGSELDKMISQLFTLGEDIQGMIDDTYSSLNTIGK